MTENAVQDADDYLTLKWETLKAWKFTTPKGRALVQRYHDLGRSMSSMLQHDTPEQKEILCLLIDECGAKEIWLDWDGKKVSKEEAKTYVMEYSR